MDRRSVEQSRALAEHLGRRREAILDAWWAMVLADPRSATARVLSLGHFRDFIPQVLDSFERRLRHPGGSREDEGQAEHGLHRWQQGYSLRELVAEWGHLQICVLRELERYGLAHPGLQSEVMPFAREEWTRLCGEGITESVAMYSASQKAQADGVLNDLQGALEKVQGLDRQRAEVWHEAAHDLRGNIGVMTTTASLLAEDGVPEAVRAKALKMLQNGISVLLQLLEDLMSLARLEAGREQRNLQTFDAAACLSELCSMLEPVAAERGLSFVWEGPTALEVEGDSAKVRRIVQNLALNALKYTRTGGVTVIWAESLETDVPRWRIRNQDTGPGLSPAVGSPLGSLLRKATEDGRTLEERDGETGIEPVPAAAAAPPAPPPPGLHPGEGIGLSIVKRLCDLLEAGLEVVSGAEGTVFQVVLPRRYPSGLPGRSEPT